MEKRRITFTGCAMVAVISAACSDSSTAVREKTNQWSGAVTKVGEVVTDANGRFLVTSIPDGDYYIVASSPDATHYDNATWAFASTGSAAHDAVIYLPRKFETPTDSIPHGPDDPIGHPIDPPIDFIIPPELPVNPNPPTTPPVDSL